LSKQIRVTGEINVGDEPFEELFDGALGGVVVGEFVQIGNRRECDNEEILHRLIEGVTTGTAAMAVRGSVS